MKMPDVCVYSSSAIEHALRTLLPEHLKEAELTPVDPHLFQKAVSDKLKGGRIGDAENSVLHALADEIMFS